MAGLDKTRLKGTIKAAYTGVSWNTLEANAALDAFCDALAGAIIDEMKQIKVSYTNGLTAGTTPVAGTFNNTIS
jgi:hypothetical protein